MTLSRRAFLQGSALLAATGTIAATTGNPVAAQAAPATRFAVIGDYGTGSAGASRVSDLVHSWNPSFVATLGDNIYSGDNANLDAALAWKIGRLYGNYVGSGNFFPALGNHDWGDPGTALLTCDVNGNCSGKWLSYFNLPGNGRYYNVKRGEVEIFVLDDYYLEPDGNRSNSKQALWLRAAVAASTATWKVAIHHYPGYLSGASGLAAMRWPFAAWGLDAVFSGHTHLYERLQIDGIPYFVNGVGGAPVGRIVGSPRSESRSRYDADHGAQRVTASRDELRIDFINTSGTVIDTYIKRADNPVSPPPAEVNTALNWPVAGATQYGRVKMTGWATADDGVSHVWVVLKQLSTGRFWTGSDFSPNKRAVRVEVANRGNTGSAWEAVVPNVAAGNYQIQAWTASLNGVVDPTGTRRTQFSVV